MINRNFFRMVSGLTHRSSIELCSAAKFISSHNDAAYTHTYTHYTHTHMYKHIHTHTHIHTCTNTFTHTYTHVQTHKHMYKHIHTHIHMYKHIHTHSYTHVQTHKHMYKHIHTHSYTHVQTHKHMYKHIHTHSYTHTHIHTCTNTFTHTYTHVKTHTHMYKHIHTHTYTHAQTHVHIHVHKHTHTSHPFPYGPGDGIFGGEEDGPQRPGCQECAGPHTSAGEDHWLWPHQDHWCGRVSLQSHWRNGKEKTVWWAGMWWCVISFQGSVALDGSREHISLWVHSQVRRVELWSHHLGNSNVRETALWREEQKPSSRTGEEWATIRTTSNMCCWSIPSLRTVWVNWNICSIYCD